MSARTRALASTFAPDPVVLMVSLRDARRGQDLELALEACEGLLSMMTEGWHEDPPSGRLRCWLDDPRIETPVREALEWSVRHIAPRLEPDNVIEWIRQPKHTSLMWGREKARLKCQATRIANIARLLPNPQPMETQPSTTGRMVQPAPTHALRLYVDALKLAKGERWWAWFGAHVLEMGWTYPYSPHRLEQGGGKVWSNGTIECSPECPHLPRVT